MHYSLGAPERCEGKLLTNEVVNSWWGGLAPLTRRSSTRSG